MVDTRNKLAGLSDRYSIIDKLAEGAYGSVFRSASDPALEKAGINLKREWVEGKSDD